MENIQKQMKKNTINNKHNTIDYYNQNIIKSNNIYLDVNQERFYLTKPDYNTLKYYGGILLDETSLGKTLCFITLSLQNQTSFKNIEYIYNSKSKIYLKTKATLIICPNYLCNHWLNEINKHSDLNTIDLKIICITTKNQYEKITYQDILDADFIILSINFLDNPIYKNLIKSYQGNQQNFNTIFSNIRYELLNNIYINNLLNQNNIIFQLFSWGRIIIDQTQEIIKKIDLISSLYGRYKWCITNKSFLESNLIKILNIICIKNTPEMVIDETDITPNVWNIISNKLYRYNTHESVKKEFQIDNKKDKIIWLNFTNSEMYIYNYYENIYNIDTILQFCSHPHICEQTKNFIKNCKTIYDIKNTLIKLNNKYINNYNEYSQVIKDDIVKFDKNKQELENITDINDIKYTIDNKLEILHNECDKIDNKLLHYKNNINYLNNFKIDENNICPICLNTFDKIAITYCGHIYCHECMSLTIKQKVDKCPICRSAFRESEILYLVDRAGQKVKLSQPHTWPAPLKPCGGFPWYLLWRQVKTSLERRRNAKR